MSRTNTNEIIRDQPYVLNMNSTLNPVDKDNTL